MLKIGLTGGIGCGKTTVTRLFSNFDVPIIDADEIAHQLVKVNQPALQTIKNVLGAEILLANGELNRFLLKKRIFENSHVKRLLEDILHPLIFQEISNKLDTLSTSYCIICIPLLFEVHAQFLVDRILVVDCNTETQIKRVQERDNIPLKQIQAIMTSQVSANFRRMNAHEVLENNQTNTILAEEVKKLHHFYLSLCHC